MKYADNLQPARADFSVADDEGYAFNYEFTGADNSTYLARPWMSWQYDVYCLDNS